MTTPRYSKRHYEDVARILAYHDSQCRPVAPAHSGAHRPMQSVAKSFADLFAADNPKGKCPGGCGTSRLGFDRERFLKACGLEEERP